MLNDQVELQLEVMGIIYCFADIFHQIESQMKGFVDKLKRLTAV